MSRRLPVPFGQLIVDFFETYLPSQRGMSIHTLRSYRDAMVLLLQFTAKDTGRRLEGLGIEDFTVPRIERFLTYLEKERGNGINTRNARLAAIHTFARHLGAKHPEQLGWVQRILNIPFKLGAKERVIEYPESADIERLMNRIDRRTPLGQRDIALFGLMLNTGARVQEVLSLRVRDLRLDPPEQVRLHGKGDKIRLCPLWPRTARLLRDLIADDDRVVARWIMRGTHTAPLALPGMNLPPTSKQIAVSGISICRVAGGKLVEELVQGDWMGMMQQLGAIPAPGQMA